MHECVALSPGLCEISAVPFAYQRVCNHALPSATVLNWRRRNLCVWNRWQDRLKVVGITVHAPHTSACNRARTPSLPARLY